MTRLSRLSAGATVALGLVVLSACGSTATVSGDDVAEQVSTQLTKTVGQKPDKVTCPELKAEKGEKVTCKLTDSGQTYDTAVTVTSVDGTDVKFSVKVASQPN